MGLLIMGAVIALSGLWIFMVRQKLTAMNENINTAMDQIGIQLSSRLEALNVLVDLVKGYTNCEAKKLMQILGSHCNVITETSAPDEILKQECVIAEAMKRIFMVAEQYPELKTNEKYGKCINAVDSYGKMMCTSRLIYNDSVTKWNREIRTFPVSLVSGILGFHQRAYFEEAVEE